jgi:hypothetical protein
MQLELITPFAAFAGLALIFDLVGPATGALA